MCGCCGSVGADKLLEQGGGARLGVGEFEPDQVAIARWGAAHMADTRLQRAEVVHGSKPHRVKAFDGERPLREDERATSAEILNLN